MAETKEGIPLGNSNIPVALRPTAPTPPPITSLPPHPLDLYFQKSPAEIKSEIAKLEKTAQVIRNHWTFVFIGLTLTAYSYYRNFQTGRTLKEIRNYIRSKK